MAEVTTSTIPVSNALSSATTPSSLVTPSSSSSSSTTGKHAGGAPHYTVAAILTESDTTITAFQVPGTTGLEVVDGTTLEWRHAGITIANGDVISAEFNGLGDRTTTAEFAPITLTGASGSVSWNYGALSFWTCVMTNIDFFHRLRQRQLSQPMAPRVLNL